MCPEAKFGSYPEGLYADISLILSTVKMESIVYVNGPSPHVDNTAIEYINAHNLEMSRSLAMATLIQL